MARYLAEESNMQCKHGAVITNGGKIVSTGFNNNERNVWNGKVHGFSLHAECQAVINYLRTFRVLQKQREKQ